MQGVWWILLVQGMPLNTEAPNLGYEALGETEAARERWVRGSFRLENDAIGGSLNSDDDFGRTFGTSLRLEFSPERSPGWWVQHDHAHANCSRNRYHGSRLEPSEFCRLNALEAPNAITLRTDFWSMRVGRQYQVEGLGRVWGALGWMWAGRTPLGDFPEDLQRSIHRVMAWGMHRGSYYLPARKSPELTLGAAQARSLGFGPSGVETTQALYLSAPFQRVSVEGLLRDRLRVGSVSIDIRYGAAFTYQGVSKSLELAFAHGLRLEPKLRVDFLRKGRALVGYQVVFMQDKSESIGSVLFAL